jgi:hypothetical protein
MKKLRGEDLRERVERVIAQASALDLGTAKRIAVALLDDAEKFQCHNTAPGAAEAVRLSQLGPELQGLLTRYARIDAVYADFRLSRTAIAPATASEGMIVLGEDADNSQILVFPNDDRIYIAADTENAAEEAEQYASIYHYIALLGALVYDVELPPLTKSGSRVA